jgi:hypothetical protein
MAAIPYLIEISSEIELTERLQSMLATPSKADDELLHAEWMKLLGNIRALMQGTEGWDYSLMEWPTDVPLFNICMNSISTASAIHLSEFWKLLQDTKLSWVIRIEFYDRIREGVMYGGDGLQDILLTKNEAHIWTPNPARLIELKVNMVD